MPRHDHVTRQWHPLPCLEGSRGLTPDGLSNLPSPNYLKQPDTYIPAVRSVALEE